MGEHDVAKPSYALRHTGVCFDQTIWPLAKRNVPVVPQKRIGKFLILVAR